MKISVITFHNTANYGATLQCAALSGCLARMGHDVSVIDYMPGYVRDKRSAFRELRKVGAAGRKARALVKGLAYLQFFRDIQKKNERYDRFIAAHLQTTRTYRTEAELREDPPQSDLYICGSDQIWNPALTGGSFDEAFFLRFAQGERAAYGVSTGELRIEERAAELNRLTEGFKAVSAREKATADRLAAILGRPVPAVLDCTLLLDRKDYYEMEEQTESVREPFLLLYNIQNSDISVSIARTVAEQRGLSIVDISPNPFRKIKGTRKMTDIGPGEFLDLFHRASYVVTNSFHGTAFSVIYEKPFIVVPHSTRAARILNLADTLGLRDRIALESGYRDPGPVDYEAVGNRLRTLRRASMDYLRGILGEPESVSDPDEQTSGEERGNASGEAHGGRHGEIPQLTRQRVLCCGCGACADICPHGAIGMREDEEGFLYPFIDSELCVGCRMCERVCSFKKDLAEALGFGPEAD